MIAGEFEDNLPYNSTWATGDWNGDFDFTTADFVLAMSKGGYSPRARAVPEATSGLWLFCLLAVVRCQRIWRLRPRSYRAI